MCYYAKYNQWKNFLYSLVLDIYSKSFFFIKNFNFNYIFNLKRYKNEKFFLQRSTSEIFNFYFDFNFFSFFATNLNNFYLNNRILKYHLVDDYIIYPFAARYSWNYAKSLAWKDNSIPFKSDLQFYFRFCFSKFDFPSKFPRKLNCRKSI